MILWVFLLMVCRLPSPCERTWGGGYEPEKYSTVGFYYGPGPLTLEIKVSCCRNTNEGGDQQEIQWFHTKTKKKNLNAVIDRPECVQT